jgi:hypothetical protein
MLRRAISELKDIFSEIQRRNINLTEKFNNPFDFKKREQEYYKKLLETGMRKVKANLAEGLLYGKEKHRQDLDIIKKNIELIEEKIKLGDLLEAISIICSTRDIPDIKVEKPLFETKSFFLPHVPREIYYETKSNFDEITICFENRCYRAATILCGKILEVALHRKYFEVTGKDMLEKAPSIGLGNMLVRLKEAGIIIEPGLSNQIHIINQLRVATVHKKVSHFVPSRAQCQATILYTLDALKKLFRSSYNL